MSLSQLGINAMPYAGLQASRGHVVHNAAQNAPHQKISHLAELAAMAEHLVRQANAAPLSIGQLNAHLCVNCRELNAADSNCAGQSLERCLMLSGAYRRRLLLFKREI